MQKQNLYILLILLLTVAWDKLDAQILLPSIGSANAFAVTYPAVITSPPSGGIEFTFRANHSITGAATLDLNGTGAKPILKNFNKSLEANDIVTGQFIRVIYDESSGGSWQMLSTNANPLPSGALTGLGSAGAVNFWIGTSTQSADAANFTWDNTNKRLGIGTSSPSEKLTVEATAPALLMNSNTISNQAKLIFSEASVNKWQLGKQGDNSFFLYDVANSKDALRVNLSGNVLLNPVSGNVAIGHSNPLAQLDVTSNVTSDTKTIFSNVSTGNVGIELRTNNAVGAQYIDFTVGSTSNAVNGTPDYTNRLISGATSIAFQRSPGFTTLSINNSTGNVMIGQSTPNERLTVEGNLSASGTAFAQNIRINALANGVLSVNGTGNVVLAPSLGDNLGNHTATTQVLGTSGSAGAPSYSFVGNPNTGMYQESTNIVGIATAGVQRMRVDGFGYAAISDGLLIGALGQSNPHRLEVRDGSTLLSSTTAAASELRFEEGTNTAGDHFTAFRAGDQATSITYTLPIEAPTTGQILTAGATPTNLIWANAALTGSGTLEGINFWTGASTQSADVANLFWDNTNKRLGVGTESPSIKVQFHENSATPSQAKFSNLNTGLLSTDGADVGIDANGNFEIRNRENFGISFWTNNTARVNVSPTGGVGIGVTNPNAPLQFSNATTNRKIVLFESANNDHQFMGLGQTPGIFRFQVDNNVSDFVFYTGMGAASSLELFRVKGTGNVGIGTSNPTQLLELYNANNSIVSVRSAGTGALTSASLLLFTQANNLIDNLGTAATTKGWEISGRSNAYTGQANRLKINFFNGSVWNEHFTLLPDGRLGIGALTPAERLTVADNAATASLIQSYVSGAAGASQLRLMKGRGTQASPSAVIANDVIGRLSFSAQFDNTPTGFTGGFGIRGEAVESFSVTNQGGRMVFTTTPLASASPIDRLYLDEKGDMLLGIPAMQGARQTNQRTLVINSNNYTGTEAPSVIEMVGTSTDIYGILGEIDFWHRSPYQAYNNARIEVTRNGAGLAEANMNFYTRTGSTLLNRMTITNLGRVGIGTTAPGYSFELEANTVSTNPMAYLDNLGAGDASMGFGSAGVDYTIGIDNSDASTFKIAYGSTLGTSEAIAVTTSNFVGIGTNSPSERLEVLGNVEIPAANEYKFATPKTNYASVPVGGFTSNFSGYQVLKIAGTAGTSYIYMSGGAIGNNGYATASIQLPDGVTVTGLKSYLYKNTGSSINTNVYLVRNAVDASGTESVMATITKSTNGTTAVLTSTNSIVNPEIDNNNYSYSVVFRGSENSADNRVYGGVVITYQSIKTD